MSSSTNSQVFNLMRDELKYSPESLFRIETKTKSVIYADEEDEDQAMDSPLSELDEEEILALGIAAGHVLEADRKRLAKMKLCNPTAPEPTSITREKTHTGPRRSQRATMKTATSKLKNGTKAQYYREETSPECPKAQKLAKEHKPARTTQLKLKLNLKPSSLSHISNTSSTRRAPKPQSLTPTWRLDEIASSAESEEAIERSGTGPGDEKSSVQKMTGLIYRVAGQALTMVETYARFVEQRTGEGSMAAWGAEKAAGRLFERKRKGVEGGCVVKKVRFEEVEGGEDDVA